MIKQLQKDERGMGHVLLIVLGIIVLIGIAGVGWKVASNHKKTNSGSSSTSSSGGTTSNSSTQTSSCLATYHDANICHFANYSNLDKLNYTATLNVTQQGTTSSMTLANQGNGNIELKSTGGGQTIDSIIYNNTMYVKDSASGSWIQYPSGSAAPTTNPTSNMNIGVGSNGITFKSLSTEACGSLTCFKYQVTDTAAPNTTQYVWFDNSSYKLREWKYSDNTGDTTDMTITYGNANITMPSPVESLSSSLGQ